MRGSVFSILMVVLLFSCNTQEDFDDQGRLFVKALQSSAGNLRFAPMQRSQSNPGIIDTFYYHSKPFSGTVVRLNEQDSKLMEGQMKNGLMSGEWKFFYATGGIQMEGKYEKGMEVGLWTSYYGYNKKKVQKYYDEKGFLLSRIDYYNNGKIQVFQNVKHPLFGDKERNISQEALNLPITIFQKNGDVYLKIGEKEELIGQNVFGL